MRIGAKKIGVGVLLVAVAVLLGVFRPGVPQDSGEAALLTPGGASAMPSALPGIPAVANQGLPAIAPASGPGAVAVAGVNCDVAGAVGACPDVDADGVSPVTFVITRVFPSGSPAATFVANGGTTLVCADQATCDVSNTVGAVYVQVAGGGVNEVVRVTGTDESGDSRGANIIFVETIFAVNPVNSGSASAATIISYRCPDVGLLPADTDGDGVTLGDAADLDWENLLETVLGLSFDPKDTEAFYPCGGNTGSPVDDRVNFETDLAILTVEEPADSAVALGTLDPSCDVGDSVDVLDSPSVLAASVSQLCDLDFAPNGVVSYGLLGTGPAGVASVTGQQSGGGGVLRTINVTFAGAAALSLFIDAPASVGLTGADFNVTIVDAEGRPISGQTVECSVSPTGGALVILPQTGTSDANGNVAFSMIPTGASVLGGEELTITCFLDSNPDVRASTTVNLSTTPETETLDVVAGCNFEAWTGADATEPDDIAAGVDPAENLAGLWAQQPAPNWKGFSPEFPEVSDMGPVDQLDVIAVCMTDEGTFTRPVL